jgi:hypothetical protein
MAKSLSGLFPCDIPPEKQVTPCPKRGRVKQYQSASITTEFSGNWYGCMLQYKLKARILYPYYPPISTLYIEILECGIIRRK